MVSAQVGFFFATVVALAIGAPQFGGPRPYYPGGPGGFVPIASQHYDLNPDQSYSFSYRSADGSARDEVGAPRAPGPEGPAVTVQGSFAYQSPEGPVQVSYVADENGYQPQGNNIHPAIIKAVAQQVAQARSGTPYNQGGYYNQGAYNPGFNGAYNPGFPGAYNPGYPGAYRAPYRQY